MQFIDSTVALQIVLNGSEFVLGCELDETKRKLIAVQWLSASNAKGNHTIELNQC